MSEDSDEHEGDVEEADGVEDEVFLVLEVEDLLEELAGTVGGPGDGDEREHDAQGGPE